MTILDFVEVDAVYCCMVTWTDRLGQRRSIVVVPRDGEAAQSYATRRLQRVGRLPGDPYLWGWGFQEDPDDPSVRRRAEARRKAEKDIEARSVTISLHVPISVTPAQAARYADATDAMLAAVDRTDAEWAAAGARAARWWNAPFAQRLRTRAPRWYREAMDVAAREYAEAVDDLPERVGAQVARADDAERERLWKLREEESRRSRARQRVVSAADKRRVWQVLVEDGTAYIKRSDVAPTAAMPPAGRRWSEPLVPYAMWLEIADLTYQRMMVPPAVRDIVVDEAAADAVRREFHAVGADPDGWWEGHHQHAVQWKAEYETSRRRGGYSSGSFC
jgi:hypothetical protein